MRDTGGSPGSPCRRRHHAGRTHRPFPTPTSATRAIDFETERAFTTIQLAINRTVLPGKRRKRRKRRKFPGFRELASLSSQVAVRTHRCFSCCRDLFFAFFASFAGQRAQPSGHSGAIVVAQVSDDGPGRGTPGHHSAASTKSVAAKPSPLRSMWPGEDWQNCNSRGGVSDRRAQRPKAALRLDGIRAQGFRHRRSRNSAWRSVPTWRRVLLIGRKGRMGWPENEKARTSESLPASIFGVVSAVR